MLNGLHSSNTFILFIEHKSEKSKDIMDEQNHNTFLC